MTTRCRRPRSRGRLIALVSPALGALAAATLAARCVLAAPPPGAAAGVSVLSVGDLRGEGSPARCEVEIALAGVAAGDVAAARVVVAAAVDDTGRDLVPPGARDAAFESTGPAGSGEDGGGGEPAVVVVKLRNPARRAKAIARVAGEVELYLPARDPDAVATIPAIAGRAGTALESPALAAAGVRIAVLTREQLEAEKQRRAEERKEAARKRGALGEMVESIASAFVAAFSPPEPGDLILRVDDPGRRIVGMALLDEGGTEGGSGWSRQDGIVLLSSTPAGPDPGWSLRVRLLTPASTQRLPFALQGLRLP